MFSRRVSIHFTGFASCIAIQPSNASSPYTFSFDPKPPPTSGVITRSLFSGIPIIKASCVRNRCGICVDDQMVSSSSPGQYAARLHRDWSEALVNHFLRDDAISRLQRSFDVAFAGSEFVSDVVTEL